MQWAELSDDELVMKVLGFPCVADSFVSVLDLAHAMADKAR